MYKNKKLSIIFELIIVIISGLAIYLNFKMFDNIAGLLYYTILSNVFCFAFYFVTVILKIFGRLQKKEVYFCTKGLLLLSILCTMIIYNFLIIPSGTVGEYVNHNFECALVHVVVPFLTLFDCLLFESKRVLKYKYLLYWGMAIIIYGIVIIIYSKMGGLFLNGAHYPYFMIDIEKYGYLKCMIMSGSVVVIYEIIGFIIILIDNKIKQIIK